MRILIADDHGLFVEGLQNLLQAGGHQVVGAAYDGLEALQLARELCPDLVLMDIRMPNCDGLEATRLIRKELPEIKIVILTTSDEDADLFNALKSGANGYLLKNLRPNQLFDYLAGLARGEAPLSHELSARLLGEFARQAAALDEYTRPFSKHGDMPHGDMPHGDMPHGDMPHAGMPHAGRPESGANLPTTEPHPCQELTARQRQVLEMVAEGMSYKEIGAVLHVSENTVKYHMREIFQRLNAKNREQVVVHTLRSGMVHGSDAVG
jgi:two-component system NarL family response regulator